MAKKITYNEHYAGHMPHLNHHIGVVDHSSKKTIISVSVSGIVIVVVGLVGIFVNT